MKRANLLEVVFLTIVLLPFVSAQFSDPSYFLSVLIEQIQRIFSQIFGTLLGDEGFDSYLFVRILFLIIVYLLVKVALKSVPMFKEQKAVSTIVAIVVAILGVRYIGGYEVIETLLVPYSALGIALTTILPFLVYFYFVEKSISSGVGRRIAWILYLIILFGIWVQRAGDIGPLGNYIYLAMFILALSLIFFDKTVKAYFALGEVKKTMSDINAEQISKAYKEYLDHLETYHRTGSEHSKRAVKRYGGLLKKMGVKDIVDVD